RFYLLGQSLEGMQVYDARRAIQAARDKQVVGDSPLWLQSRREMAGVALYASLFEPNIKRLDLWSLPRSHRDGPALLNVQRFLDLPQTVALAAEKSQVVLYPAEGDEAEWPYPKSVVDKLGWDAKQLQIRVIKK
ncbi:MAG TPA: hypothetical protein PLV92_24440, partial [Pirellulaceae bacterium]|nr:hypothetical protein [Pirellulaceae bacterium]